MNNPNPSHPLSEPELVEGVAALGYGFNESILSATRRLYGPAILLRQSREHNVSRDVSYGEHERHVLDVYRGPGQHRPVIVYVHGGGFSAGDKRGDDVFYSNLGHYFAEAGYVCVVMNYRLAPAHGWPAGAMDIQRALKWIVARIAGYGGDPQRLILMGQSAGATHAATYLFDPDFSAHACRNLKAAILLNGVYEFAAPLSGGTLGYLGDDGTAYARRSPLAHVSNSKLPLMVAVSQFDPPSFVVQGFQLASAVTKRDGKSPVFYWMEGHNHVSIVQSLGSGQDDVGIKLRRFLDRL